MRCEMRDVGDVAGPPCPDRPRYAVHLRFPDRILSLQNGERVPVGETRDFFRVCASHYMKLLREGLS